MTHKQDIYFYLKKHWGYDAFRPLQEKIIESMHIDKSYHEEIARKAGIALFHIYGKNHPVTKSQRKYFDMAIY